MPDLRKWFRQNVARVKADADRASKELVERLKRMTPAEFLRQPSRTFASLTMTQYREVVGAIEPHTVLPAPPAAEEIPAAARTWRDWWRERSVLTKSVATTIAITLTIVMAAIGSPLALKWISTRTEIVRPVSTATWPICARLSTYTDGCVYRPAQDLDWAWVAQQLGMSPQELYTANQHLPTQYIPANSTLVVWRHRGRLEQ